MPRPARRSCRVCPPSTPARDATGTTTMRRLLLDMRAALQAAPDDRSRNRLLKELRRVINSGVRP